MCVYEEEGESYELLVTLSLTLIANFCKKVSEESTDPLVETRERRLWRGRALLGLTQSLGYPITLEREWGGREGGREGGRDRGRGGYNTSATLTLYPSFQSWAPGILLFMHYILCCLGVVYWAWVSGLLCLYD